MKALLLNGSPHEKGSTFTALRYVEDALNGEGVESELFHVPPEPIKGCFGCRACRQNGLWRCVMHEDAVNVIIDKMEAADALVIGSPVYYASPNGHFLAALDRVFFAGSGADIFRGKPAAAICAARRGGATATLEVLQKYFTLGGMPLVPSSYWPMIHGHNAEEVVHDAEGVQAMQMVGLTIAWLLKCIEAGKMQGIEYPGMPGGEKISTNFIR